MKKLKSYFWYSRTQRNGILFLIVLIIILHTLYHYLDFSQNYQIESESVIKMRAQLDSISKLNTTKGKRKIFPFNPNFINDYKGYQLGMSVKEIDRLHAFRNKGRFVNSARDFQQVTKISDSLLKEISPYFKFPDWVKNKKRIGNNKVYFKPTNKIKSELTTNDLNLATASDFYSLNSVNESLANRIINYRNKLKGFYFDSQLDEVWGINSNQVKEILKVFTIKTKPKIDMININTASFKEVLSIPYIDYDLCVKLFAYRDEVAELQSISEIKTIKGFPIKKYDRIVLYLQAK